jgi:rubrerythrin
MKKTLENLAKAFAWESMARNRYTTYSKIATKEWYIQIWQIFLETAEQEREHASRFMKMIQIVKAKLNDTSINEIEVPTTIVSKLWDTITNLETSIAWEHHEESSLYPEFASIANEEWLPEIAARINAIIEAEKHHEWRFAKLLSQLKAWTMFAKDWEVMWLCSQCGFVHTGKNPPKLCPSCGHEYNYFYVSNENY